MAEKPDNAKNPGAPATSADALGDCCQLVLIKREHRWVFRYRPGEEAVLLRALADAAGDTRHDFDWFDAAVLSHQMGDHMHQKLKQMMG